MLTKGQTVKKIRATLEDGPKRAKEIVKACKRRGVKRSKAFYWLKKLTDAGEIRKIEDKYELVRFEEMSEEDINFYIEKIKNGESDVRRFAIQEFMEACRRKMVSQHDSVWDFIGEWLKGKEDEEAKKNKKVRKEERAYAIRFLERIASNPLTLKEKKTIEKLSNFTEDLKEVVLDDSMENIYRSNAMFILETILSKQEFSDFLLKAPKRSISVFEKLVKEASRKRGSMQIDRIAWKILLDTYSRDGKLMELRKWLYRLLEDKNEKVRENAFRFLDELRGRERGLDLSIKL